jgi:hypothetical protein
MQGKVNRSKRVQSLFEALEPRQMFDGTMLQAPEPPTVIPGGPFTVGEGGAVELMSASSLSTTQLEWDFNYDGTFNTSVSGFKPTFSAAEIDGPVTRVVAVRALDASGNRSAPVTTTVIVTNVAPTATFSSGGQITLGKSGTVAFTAQTDPSAADRSAGFTYSYDFNNDGKFDLSNVTAASATVPATMLATPGIHTIRGRITDKDGSSSDYTASIFVASVTGSDQVPPAATLQTALRVRSVGGTFYKFVIRYSDRHGVNLATIDSGDIIVTGPGGFSSQVRLLSKTPINSRTVDAFYRLAARGGTWDRGDNGLYTFNQVAGQVTDLSGNARAAGMIGQFTVRISKATARAAAAAAPASAPALAANAFSSKLISSQDDMPVWA